MTHLLLWDALVFVASITHTLKNETEQFGMLQYVPKAFPG